MLPLMHLLWVIFIPLIVLATGSAYEAAVKNLIEMGFETSQVKAAMRAAFNNPDRAAEYLMTVGKTNSFFIGNS
jgi:hypothetical protein